MFLNKFQYSLIAVFLLVGLILFFHDSPSAAQKEDALLAKVKKESFPVDVRTIGELEAATSTSVSSTIRGDQVKIIYIIPDGTHVEKGDLLVKMDSTPFEEKIEALLAKFKEYEGHAGALKKALDGEISQAERDDRMAAFEVEAAELELTKITFGDGPLEIARLKGAMQKAFLKYEEFNGYSIELAELEQQGYLNPSEVKNALKKLEDEKEAYEAAKLQYETYLEHVFPMIVKKGEGALKQAKIKQVETIKIRGHAIEKARLELEHAYQNLEAVRFQIGDAERELALSEIKAQAQGMVVHKEDYRSGQRRKPRIGDIVLKNQIILELPDLSAMTVKTKVRESDLCKVEIGRPATMEVDAYPGLYSTGKITTIGVLALPDPGKPAEEKYFEIRILLDGSDSRLRPGMTARVTLHADLAENVLSVPIHAVFHDQKGAYCYVGEEKRGVVVGLCNEEFAEIKSGLKEGESVCLTIPQETSS
jgi:HlyD family secretion protein